MTAEGSIAARAGGAAVRVENALSISVLAAMTLVAIAEVAGHAVLGRGIPGSIPLVQHLTLVIAMLGAALAARNERLLALATAALLPERAKRPARVVTSAAAAAIAAVLAFVAIDLVHIERETGAEIGLGIPLWWAMLVIPFGFGLVALRALAGASDGRWGRVAALAVAAAVAAGAWLTGEAGPGWLVPGLAAIALLTVLGMPIFAAIGGAALLLFWKDGVPLASVPEETYRLAASPMLPAVPLFTLGGYLLAESGASRRLLRLFTALFGWMPGGLALATTALLAMFTPLTGASGVTILSMGGLLLPLLVRARYPERFSIGLVTVSGSIGLLLPPSLPVILYAVTANLSVADLFVAGLLPGALLIGIVAAWGVRAGVAAGTDRTPFAPREALAAMWESKWELAMPVVVLAGYFGGYTTLVEAAALTVVWAIVTACFVHRELSLRRDVPRVFVECATLVGGFLIILGVALGLTNYLVLDDVPTRALGWVQAHVESPLVFLLALNLFLLIVGGLMDIYSAIFVVVPLVAPMASAYGIEPLHLAVIFLANLELGYLTPPMGENLFLSAYRFNQPLGALFRAVLPFWLLLLAGVLLITYVPLMF